MKRELNATKARFNELNAKFHAVSNELSQSSGRRHDLEEQYKEVSEELNGTAEKRRKEEKKKAKGTYGQRLRRFFGCGSANVEKEPVRLEDLTNADDILKFVNNQSR